MGKSSLGEFEQLVMLAIMRLGERAYAVPIAQEIEQQTGRSVSQAAVYVVLRRLEEKGLARSSFGDPTPERGGRSKRYYMLRPIAREQLELARDALMSMWDGLEQEA